MGKKIIAIFQAGTELRLNIGSTLILRHDVNSI